MPGKRRLKPYVIDPLPGWLWQGPELRAKGHRYIALSPGGKMLGLEKIVTGPSEEAVRQRMAKKHPEYVEQPRLFAMEESDMSAYQRIESGGEQR